VAIFIVQKILLDEMGLAYICATYERFYAVGTVLSNMVNQLVETQAVRLLKHVVRCYLRLSDNPRFEIFLVIKQTCEGYAYILICLFFLIGRGKLFDNGCQNHYVMPHSRRS
jgi:hypothetical protein